MSEIKKKYNNIDLFKFLMAFAVVAIHIEPMKNSNSDLAVKIYSIVVAMAVPYFFMSSGYLLASKIKWTFDEDDISKLRRHLFKIIKMYIVWTVIYTPLSIYHFISEGKNPIIATLSYIRGLLLIGEHYNSWPLWYLLSTIYALSVIIFFLKKYKKIDVIVMIAVFSSVVCVGITAFVEYAGVYVHLLEVARKIIKLSIINGRIFSGLVYIPLGMIFSRKKLSPVINVFMLVGASIVHIFAKNAFASGYLTIISSIGLFGLVEILTLSDRLLYSRLRFYSTSIYFIHMYIWSAYYMIIYGEKTFGADCFVATSIISLIISVTYYYLFKRKKHEQFLRVP